MKIESLKDLKDALIGIPDNVLETMKVTYDAEGKEQMAILSFFSDSSKTEDEKRNEGLKMFAEYPALGVIDGWLDAIVTNAIAIDKDEAEADNIKDSTEPISFEKDV